MSEWRKIEPTKDMWFACDAWRLCGMQYLHCDHREPHRWRANCWFICPYEEGAECVEVKKSEVKSNEKVKDLSTGRKRLLMFKDTLKRVFRKRIKIKIEVIER